MDTHKDDILTATQAIMYQRTFITFVIGAILGALGTLSFTAFFIKKETPSEYTCYSSPLINKFACLKPVIDKAEYSNMRVSLEAYIEDKKKSGAVSDVGLYFRDLKGGPTLGINEYNDFITASLLKLPTLIVYLRLAEQKPSLLQESITVSESMISNVQAVQFIKPKEPIFPNTSYTIEELLRRLVVYSDNTALVVLNEHLRTIVPDVDILVETFKELGLLPDAVEGDYTLTVKRFSSVFRLLYSATYLSPEMSAKALTYLSESAYIDGLVAGVPATTLVAHKFGERTTDLPDGSAVRQLHDCGIVYYPDNPYLLCVMTAGTDFSNLSTTIQDISRMVYEEVDSRRIVK